MIKINLLGDEIKRDSSVMFWLLGMGVSVLGFAIVATFLFLDVSSKSTIRAQEVEDLDRQLAQLKEKTKEVGNLEAKRSELNQKIAIIADLKMSKYGPVRVLDDLNQSVPERAWITDVRERGAAMSIVGYALDGQTVATMMDSLERSDYFGDIKVETRKSSYEGVSIQNFTLSMKLNYAGNLKSTRAKKEEEEAQKEGATQKEDSETNG